jgi:uncharacterized protein HemY
MENFQDELPVCYFWLADLYARANEFKKVKICYLKAYALTESASCLYMLAVALKKTGKPNLLVQAKGFCIKAIQAYEHTVGSKCPQITQCTELQAKICIQLGQLHEAYQLLHSQPTLLKQGLAHLISQTAQNVKQSQSEMLLREFHQIVKTTPFPLLKPE